jgi:DNA-binding NtrC family response regulator
MRFERPFIPVNCGAIPETIIDSQLFGHVRGSFTGASADHLGLVRAADGGTLFLDEVSELPPSAQTRLLRLLQEGEVQPVGRPTPVFIDARVIAASNRDLRHAVSESGFRNDLMFRLDVVQLRVKPLRERTGELRVLLDSFNAEFAEMYDQPTLTFDRPALNVLKSFTWPGNIRQLRSVVERLHVLCPQQTVTVQRLLEIGQLTDSLMPPAPVQSLQQVKAEAVRRVLIDAGGSVARAATVFGVHRSTIYRWLKYWS